MLLSKKTRAKPKHEPREDKIHHGLTREAAVADGYKQLFRCSNEKVPKSAAPSLPIKSKYANMLCIVLLIDMGRSIL